MAHSSEVSPAKAAGSIAHVAFSSEGSPAKVVGGCFFDINSRLKGAVDRELGGNIYIGHFS